MTAETLSAAAGILLSLAAAYIPPFAPWFSRLDGVRKRLVMLGMLTAVTLISFLIECLGWSAAWTGGSSASLAAAGCTPPAAIQALRVFIAALVANQAAYQIGPYPQNHPAAPHDDWLDSLNVFDE